jgi:PHP family Zn ribbon phosphoesterase
MTPSGIVRQAKRLGLDAVALCDHNSAENVSAAKAAGARENVVVLGGMEVTTREEVHVLALFDDLESLEALQRIVYDNLPGENAPDVFGEQYVVDENDEITAVNDHMLIGACDISLERLVSTIHDLSGIAVASHVDRQGFGIIGQLGFIPPGLPLDALEVSPKVRLSQARATLPVEDFPLLTSSDAHYLREIAGSSTVFALEEITVAELRKALRGEAGRKVVS